MSEPYFGEHFSFACRLTHSDERKYLCTVCMKSFKRQDHLSGHLLTHSDKKPFSCPVENCGKSYCDSRSLKRHLDQHESVCTHSSRTARIRFITWAVWQFCLADWSWLTQLFQWTIFLFDKLIQIVQSLSGLLNRCYVALGMIFMLQWMIPDNVRMMYNEVNIADDTDDAMSVMESQDIQSFNQCVQNLVFHE